jgi:signal transduction histidine kinase
MPQFFRSIRFKLSIQYSAVVFGLGGAILGVIYLLVRHMLREQTMTHLVVAGQPVYVGSTLVGTVPDLAEHEMRTLESLFNEHVLEELAQFIAFSLIALFLLSIVVGWVMSGRFLRPIAEITDVASDIQASDLSRRIQLEGPDDEMTRLAATFDRMLDRLEAAFSSQRRFLADTSHDLRTPITVIRSNVEVVAADDEATVEDWREVGGIVTRNAEKMSEMIAGLLSAARLQMGNIEAVTFDLQPLILGKVVEYGPIANEAGVEVATQASPCVVSGVEVALDRALSNLLDNALGVSGPGDAVTVGCGLEAGFAWFGVRDQGPGLPPDHEVQTGLGLAIVEQIADAHGGRLAHYSNGGAHGGIAMVVWLPLDTSNKDHPAHSPFTGS